MPAEDHELLDRVRRIETRVTKIGHAMGVDVGGGRPSWDVKRGCVVLPSPNCSIAECVNIVPASREGPVDVYVGDQFICAITAH